MCTINPKLDFLFLVQKNVTLQNNANGGGGEVVSTNGARANFIVFCLFQISKGPITFIFLIFPLKKDPKKDPGGKVQ